MPTLLRLLSCALVALWLASSPAAAEPSVVYDPPVDAPITDPFRAPATKYAAGNRGIDYATDEGQPVLAAADGVVTFAGRVGHGLHLVIAHDEGVRTSYSFLASVATRRGQRVTRGEPVATATRSLHFGARIGDVYVDPRDLFGGTGVRAHLVDDDGPATAIDDRNELVDYVRRFAPRPTLDDIAAWESRQLDCTPATADPPRERAERRIALLVGGLGSSTGSAAILTVDTAAVGYARGDVHQFNYRADGAPYGPADTQQDITDSADVLARTIERIAAASPGVPIDVIAHSQGGLVARAALAQHPNAFEPVATVVTLGTPHRGNALAAAGTRLRHGVRLAGIDPSSVSVGQLAAGSELLAELDDAPPPPPHIEVRSIAAATDAVVPSPTARWADADTVVVDLDGPPTAIDHSRLVSDPTVTREIALAVARRPPTCERFATWRTNHLDGGLAGAAQEAVATAVAWASERLPAGGNRVVRR